MFSKITRIAMCAVLAYPAAGAEYFADAKNGSDLWDGTASEYVSGTTGPKKTVGAAVKLANDDGEPSVDFAGLGYAFVSLAR